MAEVLRFRCKHAQQGAACTMGFEWRAVACESAFFLRSFRWQGRLVRLPVDCALGLPDAGAMGRARALMHVKIVDVPVRSHAARAMFCSAVCNGIPHANSVWPSTVCSGPKGENLKPPLRRMRCIAAGETLTSVRAPL